MAGWQRWLLDLGDLLLPRFCPVCGSRLIGSERFICLPCCTQWPRVRLEKIDDNPMLRQMWPYVSVENAFSLIVYRHHSPFHDILIDIKYRGATKLGRSMGEWMAAEAMETGLFQQTDVIVPVPLSRKKMLKRGYNQARLLAEGISEKTHLPVKDWLTRIREHTTQTHLSEEERRLNTAQSFKAKIPEAECGQRILLVDDVFTTGSTMTACAQAILEADPEAKINIITLAYAR